MDTRRPGFECEIKIAVPRDKEIVGKEHHFGAERTP